MHLQAYFQTDFLPGVHYKLPFPSNQKKKNVFAVKEIQAGTEVMIDLPPKKHLSQMDGWCRSLPNPWEENVHFKIDSIYDVCIGKVSSTWQ